MSQTLISGSRILRFLEAEELEDYIQRDLDADLTRDGGKPVVISFDHASLGWTKHTPTDSVDPKTKDSTVFNRSYSTLTDLSLQIKQGELVAIIGSVGSGKSSLLSALLGEMLLHEGQVHLSRPSSPDANTAIAYCDQRPWILNATIKDNILFGLPYDPIRLQFAIHAACLDDDLFSSKGQFYSSGGIDTEIGERGINLSGGQKARVALARAIYRHEQTDLYLLDDPLSAVDAHVSQYLFHQCIRKALAGKTRLLVTHQTQYLSYCDRIVILHDGKIIAQGSYNELLQQSMSQCDTESYCELNLSKFFETPTMMVASNISTDVEVINPAGTAMTTLICTDVEGETSDVTDIPAAKVNAQASTAHVTQAARSMSALSMKSITRSATIRSTSMMIEEDLRLPLRHARSNKNCSNMFHCMNKSERKNDRDRESDSLVPWSLYRYYLECGGWGNLTCFFIFLIISQAFTVFASFWLQYWGENDHNGMSTEKNVYFLNYYALFTCLSFLFFLIRSAYLLEHAHQTSITIHQTLLHKLVIQAAMSYLDRIPLGRILTRFTSDLSICIDEELPNTISQMVNSFASISSACIAISIATKGIFICLLIPLFSIYLQVQRYFRLINTVIARLEIVTRSPILIEINQILTGMTTIRGYNDQQRFIHTLEEKVNENTIVSLTQLLLFQWLTLRLDLLGAFVSLFVALLAVATDASDTSSSGGFISAGLLAIGLTYSFQLTQYLKYFLRVFSASESFMNSVERVKLFIDEILPEEDEMMKNKLIIPESAWPEQGKIEVKHLTMSYDFPTNATESPTTANAAAISSAVLKDISFTINPGESIGIVGRTGSGKSSLVNALFRMYPPLQTFSHINTLPTTTASSTTTKPASRATSLNGYEPIHTEEHGNAIPTVEIDNSDDVDRHSNGVILIDDINIYNISLYDLRCKLSIIPQEPILFTDTLRFNLDPFSLYSDIELWTVLEQVSLKEFVIKNCSKGLSEEVSEFGENFSMGQRQLLCIARALLRKPKILVLDEATASIDNETDALIQKMIREQFHGHCTVLTIAHRLHTIMDSDRVMVLDSGNIVEFDSPQKLLDQDNGVFKALWKRYHENHQQLHDDGK